MRSNIATARRVRPVVVLSVAAAATVMLGVILVAASVVMRLLAKGQPANIARLGLDMVAAGIAFGLVVLVVFAIARIGTAGRPRTSVARADHRQDASPGHGRAQGDGKERLRAGAPPVGGGRFARPLNPTNVYTPGGLIDVPRDGRVPGAPGGHAIPEILRSAAPPPASAASSPGAPAPGAPAPGAPAHGGQGGRGQDRHSSAWARTQPPPGYQPGMYPGGPGRGSYPPGGQAPPSWPSREYLPPQEAARPGHAMPPPRRSVPPREPVPPRGVVSSRKPRPAPVGPPREPVPVGLPRDPRLPRDAGPPRDGTGPGAPVRPAGPMPPRDPAYPSPPGQGPRQGSGAGGARPAGGPGYAAPGGYHPPPGYAGPGEPAEAAEQFDGGYAKIIRASDHPIRPSGRARPAGFGATGDPGRPPGPDRLPVPVRPAAPPAGVYVYRETDGVQDDSAPPAPGPDENDPAYWYDLPVTGPTGSDQPGGSPHAPDETRGPFEPLVSSADPPGTPPRFSSGTDVRAEAEQAGERQVGKRQVGERQVGERQEEQDGLDGQEDASHARKLERIKDLYLTAEAIGEANVDKHFDQLLAQQRELISDYFKRPATAGNPAGLAEDNPEDNSEDNPEDNPEDHQEDDLGGTRPPAGPAGPHEGARVAADQPRAW